MHALAVIVGILLVVSVLADLVNTLVTTQTSGARWWLTRQLYTRSWALMRWLGGSLRRPRGRERLFGVYAPVSVLLLLVAWVSQQVIGFGLIWWGLGGVTGVDDAFEALYYSGVVFVTLGFGEIVPSEVGPRVGALVEAFAGVVTMALVIGYLPALYAAYSERERQLMILDDGTEGRITPTNLMCSRAPTADAEDLFSFFEDWERWVAGVLETHTTFPMLVYFRSKQPDQHWITGLGVVTDAALNCQIIRGADNKAPYWMLRRSIRLFHELTDGVDLSPYRAHLDEAYDDGRLFHELYRQLEDHGFELLPYDEAFRRSRELRRRFDAPLEHLIDELMAPRGFWGHSVGHAMDAHLSDSET